MSAEQQLNRVFDLTMLVVAAVVAWILFRVVPQVFEFDRTDGRSFLKLLLLIPVVWFAFVPVLLVARNQGWYSTTSDEAPTPPNNRQLYLFKIVFVITQVWILVVLFAPVFLTNEQLVNIAKGFLGLCCLFLAAAFFCGLVNAVSPSFEYPPN